MNVLDAISAHRTLVEDDERLFSDDCQPLVSAEVLAASEAAVQAAFDALVVALCTSLDEVRAKVDYVLNGTIGVRDEVLDGLLPDGTDDRLKDFMRSLIVQPELEPDAFIDRMQAYAEEIVAYNADEDDDGPEPGSAFCSEIRNGTLAIGSAAGAVLALRRVIEIDCIVDTEGECMVDAVIAYLEGRAA